MRKTIYICDKCKKEISEYVPSNWLHIGTDKEDRSLCIKNDFKNRQIISMSSHDEINFCSEKCFINFFIKTAGVFLPPEEGHREEE